MKILGINYGGHDTSACISINGKVIAACEQERYDFKKHSRNSPTDVQGMPPRRCQKQLWGFPFCRGHLKK